MQPCRRLISSAFWFISTSLPSSESWYGSPTVRGATFVQLPQELIRRNKERVFLEDATNDDHRMGPHNVHDDIPAKLGEIIHSYDRVFIPGQNIVQPRLVLHQVVNPRAVFQGPLHMGD